MMHPLKWMESTRLWSHSIRPIGIFLCHKSAEGIQQKVSFTPAEHLSTKSSSSDWTISFKARQKPSIRLFKRPWSDLICFMIISSSLIKVCDDMSKTVLLSRKRPPSGFYNGARDLLDELVWLSKFFGEHSHWDFLPFLIGNLPKIKTFWWNEVHKWLCIVFIYSTYHSDCFQISSCSVSCSFSHLLGLDLR